MLCLNMYNRYLLWSLCEPGNGCAEVFGLIIDAHAPGR